ncbi:MAG: hypothetical protein FJ126_04635 [Deltaproteobacteria bacterium]|nr:hypothetical protein [Deltaproteobacteria bacterium]
MKKLHGHKRKQEEKHKSLVKFLERTKKGEYAEITPGYITYGRLPDYTITDYEEETYIFSYS